MDLGLAEYSLRPSFSGATEVSPRCGAETGHVQKEVKFVFKYRSLSTYCCFFPLGSFIMLTSVYPSGLLQANGIAPPLVSLLQEGSEDRKPELSDSEDEREEKALRVSICFSRSNCPYSQHS